MALTSLRGIFTRCSQACGPAWRSCANVRVPIKAGSTQFYLNGEARAAAFAFNTNCI